MKKKSQMKTLKIIKKEKKKRWGNVIILEELRNFIKPKKKKFKSSIIFKWKTGSQAKFKAR